MADVTTVTVTAPQVIVEILSGEGLSFGAVGRLLPGFRSNRNMDPSTIWRWVNKGVKTLDGHWVKLEASRVGGRWMTSRPAVARFMTAITPPDSATVTPPPRRRSEAEIRRASEQAAKQLEEMGA